jgi:hypothetical protein
MNMPNPDLQQIENNHRLISQANARLQLKNEITDLSNSNRLQMNSAQRILNCNQLVHCRLMNNQLLIGVPIKVGNDAILIKSALSYELVILDSIVAIRNMPKPRVSFPMLHPILISVLLQQIDANVVVETRDGQFEHGKLHSVWQDSLDLTTELSCQTIRFSGIVKVSLMDLR